MAASDPTMDVPTPTGVLQGVAAFSWDGSAWQPSGRAGPSVATPTGVLQGVAPFSWSGSAWTPAGRAQPGTATPTGVLDGVAVYTWSGSAWTPTAGTATPSTPSGALRGVAAFNWDGSVWQPAGQARPSVPTPYGALDGVAMFNWSGSAWAAVQGPSLTLDFAGSPGTLDPRITFTRASVGTYFDAAGVLQTAPTNTARFDYHPTTHVSQGLLIEEARTNVLLNSASLGTQSVAVTAQAYTLSFYGTGTITKSGTAAGALVGSGAFPARVSQTFTPTAGTLTLTVTGSVLNAQLEAGAFPTSYIPTTGAAVTRSADQCYITSAQMGFYVSPGGSWAVDFIDNTTTSGNRRIILIPPSPASYTTMYIDTTFHAAQYNGTGPVASANVVSTGVVSKAATTIDASTGRVCLNGGAIASGAMTGGYPTAVTGGIQFMVGATPSTEDMTGYLLRVRYWPRVLSDAEMQSGTT